MTEKEMLIAAAKRLGLETSEYSETGELCIEAYYDVRVKFDKDGAIVSINTHP